MVRSIIISGKDLELTSEPFNDTYKYTFPQGMVKFQNAEIAVSSVALWFSWYNVSQQLNNNTFSYTWNADTSTTVNVTIPDGSYSIPELYNFFQFTFIQNKHYMIDGSGNFVYFIELLWNPTKYLIELICYPLPAVTGYTIPAGATWTLPAADTTPQITFTRDAVQKSGFGYLIGFATGTYPAAPQASVYDVLATYIDKTEPVSSIVLGCSLLQNSLAIPASTLFSFPITTHEYAELTTQVGQLAFCPVIDGQYSNFYIRFYDQDGNRFILNDPDISILLVIRQKIDKPLLK